MYLGHTYVIQKKRKDQEGNIMEEISDMCHIGKFRDARNWKWTVQEKYEYR